jgi:hypothetical protein
LRSLWAATGRLPSGRGMAFKVANVLVPWQRLG